ncbi:DUF2206 domain-containing protein [Streptomyces sp. NPDC006207]
MTARGTGSSGRRTASRPSWAVEADDADLEPEPEREREPEPAESDVSSAGSGHERKRQGRGPRRDAASAGDAQAAGLRLADLVRGRLGVLLAIAVACVVEMLPGVPGVLLTVAGLWLLFGAPVAVWRGVASRVVSTRDGSFLLAVGMAVVTDLVIALAVNTVLPLAGVERPLTRVSLAGATALTLIVIGAFVPEEERADKSRSWLRDGLPPGAIPVGAFAGVALVLSVAGPIRLNNGYGGAVSTAAMPAVIALLVLLMVRRRRYPVTVLETGLFLGATALLMLNSLRGWSITGHDIQREYEYYRLTLGGSLWDVSKYPDAYNACLSITLLPVSVFRLTAIPDVYIFKIVLPLLFALTPVLVHRSVRNVAPHLVSLLSAVFFMLFPTFLSDMTFLGRQEVAFVLLGCGMVVLTDSGRPLRVRQIAFVVLLVGITLSHYSTIYVVIVVLGVALVADVIWRTVDRYRSRRARQRKYRPTEAAPFLTWWIVAGAAVMALAWAGPVTHTSGQLRSTLSAVVQEIKNPGHARVGSSDTSYSLFGGGPSLTAEQRLGDYREETVRETTADRAKGTYLPLETVDAYATPVVPKQNMAPTAAGRVLEGIGLKATTVNSLLRQFTAGMMQLLLIIGLIVIDVGRRGAFRPRREQTTLAIGAIALLGVLTVVPQLSVDYGVLRAFQQGLFFFAPFIAAGMLSALRWTGRRRTVTVYALVVALFLDLTGVVPKLLGGYPPQLQLSNAGQYYDVYYPSAEERMAAYWLSQRFAAEGKPSLVQTDRFTFNRQQTILTGPVVGDVFPTKLRTDSYVLLGTSTVRTGRMTFSYRGDLVTFRYPTGLLDTTKNEIYSSEGARIYR